MKRGEQLDFLTAVASGYPPFERIDGPFEAVPRDLAVGRRLASEWLARAAPAAGLRQPLIAASGFELEDIERMFAPLRPTGAGPLPQWARQLQLVLEGLPSEASTSDPDPADAMASCLAPAAGSLLGWDELAARHGFLSDAVLAHLTAQLSTRMLLGSWAVLELEDNLSGSGSWALGGRAWLERLSGFAGLSYVLGTAIRQWRQNALEIIARLDEDLEALQAQLFSGSGPGRLVSLQCDCGDRHNDGRSVAILGFESGRRLVYKPKNLRCAEMLLMTHAALNARTSARLPVRRILCRAGHTWEEFVEQKQGRTIEDAARFFHNYGGVVRVLQFVEGRDFWMDNLRIDGDSPVFIDLECILHPRLKGGMAACFVSGMTCDSYEESALPTAAVTHTIRLEDGNCVQFGGLSMPGERKLPLGKWAGYKDRANGSLRMRDGEIYWRPETAWPLVAGRHARPEDFMDALGSGYRDVSVALGEIAGDLVGEDGPLAGAGGAPVRVLMRSTWDYLHYLRASLEVTALLDGPAREIELAGAIASAPDWGTGDDHLTRMRIALAEACALRRLDVPEFHNLPATSSIIMPDGEEIPDLFEGTSLGRLLQRSSDRYGFDVAGEFAIIADAILDVAA